MVSRDEIIDIATRSLKNRLDIWWGQGRWELGFRYIDERNERTYDWKRDEKPLNGCIEVTVSYKRDYEMRIRQIVFVNICNKSWELSYATSWIPITGEEIKTVFIECPEKIGQEDLQYAFVGPKDKILWQGTGDVTLTIRNGGKATMAFDFSNISNNPFHETLLDLHKQSEKDDSQELK